MATNGLVYHVSALLDVKGGKKAISKMERLGNAISKRSAALNSLGKSISGTTLQTGKLMAKMAAGTAALAGAAGFGAVIKSSVAFNAQLEDSRYRMASTLSLFGHAQGNFNQNMKISEAVQKRIFQMAAKSPASFAEAEQMFANMLPGARAITGDMEAILQLQKKSLALGLITGDFQTTGAQLSRILTGGAGAEMETWRQVLQVPIKEAAKDMEGVQHLGDLMGDKLTRAFNKLAPEDRFKLVQKAMEKLPTEELGKSWRGVSSTMVSNADMIKKSLGEATFEAMKSKMKDLVGKGGLMDPNGMTMKRLTIAAQSIGNALGKYIDPMVEVLERWIRNFSKNWPSIIQKLQTAFNTGLAAAKLFLKVAIARAATGGVLQAAGGAGMMAGGAASLAGRVFGKDAKGKPGRALRMGAGGAALLAGGAGMARRGAGKVGGLGRAGARGVGSALMAQGLVGYIGDSIGGAFSQATHRLRKSKLGQGVGRAGRGARRGGGVVSGLASKGMTGILGSFGSVFAAITPALATAVPLMGAFAGIIGVALVGALGLIVAPIAYLVDNLGNLVGMFKSGKISLTPLLDALETAWDGFVKVGKALIGDTSSAEGAQGAIDGMASAVDSLIQVMFWSMKFIGLLQMAFNGLQMAVKAIAWAIYVVIDAILSLAKSVTDKLDITPAWLRDAQEFAKDGKRDIVKSGAQDLKDARQVWDAADKMLEGVASGKLAAKLKKAALEEKSNVDLGTGDGPGGDKKDNPGRQGSGKGTTVNIHKMIVNNDLRNQDPDRVIGAFNNAFMKAVTHRTQSTKLQPGGI